MDQIRIIDNFFPSDDLRRMVEHMDQQTYKFGHSSGPNETVDNQFFATYTFDEFFSIYVKHRIEKEFGHTFKINRNYGHVQTFGQDGSYHTDDTGPTKFTFCIYLSDLDDETQDSGGGEFYIKVPGQVAIMSVAPRMNRGVFFPAEFWHKGVAYLRPHASKRTCITWKLEIDSGNITETSVSSTV